MQTSDKPSTEQIFAGPELPEVVMNLHTPRDPGIGVVVSNEVCTARKAAGFVRHVAIDVSETKLAGKFRVGQAFGIIPPGEDARGKPHKVRLYSLACPSTGDDGMGKVVSTTVKRLIDEHEQDHTLFLGVASNYICDLQPGHKVKVTGPSGRRFLLPLHPEQHDYVFFATGTGIAPFRGMVQELLESGVPSRVTLIMGTPYTTDLMYDDYFREAEAKNENFRYITAVSRESQADGHKRMYVQDRLESHREELIPLLSSDRALVYICGLAGMELGIFQQLARLLPREWLARFMTVEDEALKDIAGWDRSRLKQLVKPTERVFVEVY